MMKDALFSALAVIVVVVLAAVARAEGADRAARPHAGRRQPPARVAVPVAVRPAVAQPARGGDLHHPRVPGAPHRRPVPRAVREQPRRTRPQPPAGGRAAVIVIYTVLGVLTYQGATSPWSPKMTAWSGDPVPEDLVRSSTPLQLQGAALFQNKNCRNCHALEGIGGRRGPDLTTVGTRLTRDQLIDQISNGTPGGGNMPAYGKQISPAEMTALVEFLADLRPAGAAAGPGWPPRGMTRRNTREPHARRLPALLAVRPLAPGRAAAHGRRLPARLARAPPPRPPALARRPARRVPRRAGGDLPGPGLADRAVRRRCCSRSTWCSTCCS